MYALLTFVYVLKVTDVATSVEKIDGAYFAKHKNRIIRAVTEYEYRWYPSLWVRVLSAWVGAAATLSFEGFRARRGQP